MIRPLLLLSAALLLSPASQAQQMKRQLGDFDFTLGTTPSRSMAQAYLTQCRWRIPWRARPQPPQWLVPGPVRPKHGRHP